MHREKKIKLAELTEFELFPFLFFTSIHGHSLAITFYIVLQLLVEHRNSDNCILLSWARSVLLFSRLTKGYKLLPSRYKHCLKRSFSNVKSRLDFSVKCCRKKSISFDKILFANVCYLIRGSAKTIVFCSSSPGRNKCSKNRFE